MRLGDKLFRAVEKEQGAAFISDGIDEFSDDRVLEVARYSLIHSRRVVRLLERFIRTHKDRVAKAQRKGAKCDSKK